MTRIDLSQYYTPAQAAERLSENSGKKVDTSYVRTLAKYGKLTPLKINSRLSLYPKKEVDAYVVEARGNRGRK
jgi:hypothetical protein